MRLVHLVCTSCAVIEIALAAPTFAAESAPAAHCAEESGRCTVTLPLSLATGKAGESPVGAALGLQIGQTGDAPVLFALAPLGIALRPGLRAVLPGQTELTLEIDVCFPDGCRATAPLDPAQLEALLAAPKIDLQFFPYGSDAPVAASLAMPDLQASLSAAGVTFEKN